MAKTLTKEKKNMNGRKIVPHNLNLYFSFNWPTFLMMDEKLYSKRIESSQAKLGRHATEKTNVRDIKVLST